MFSTIRTTNVGKISLWIFVIAYLLVNGETGIEVLYIICVNFITQTSKH